MELGKPDRARGRPRSFDVEQALGVAQAIFHARGYDEVSVGELTEAMGIAAPSFYSAFGSKAGLFGKVLKRYEDLDSLPLSRILAPGRPVVDSLGELLLEAAALYAADPSRRGCLALEGARCSDASARSAAEDASRRTGEAVRTFLRSSPNREDVADLVLVALAGLSARSRRGMESDRLIAVARSIRPAIAALVERDE